MSRPTSQFYKSKPNSNSIPRGNKLLDLDEISEADLKKQRDQLYNCLTAEEKQTYNQFFHQAQQLCEPIYRRFDNSFQMNDQQAETARTQFNEK